MLPKGPYKPSETEAEMLKFWLDHNFYAPEYTSDRELSSAHLPERESFMITLPPPNANGNLHLGHMSGYAYQDLMGRYQRMLGKKVLLLPGKDHAGIQTEVVFEKELAKKGKSKKDLGRETFYKACYKFCMDNSATARNQEKKIGLSADFERELFTLDPKIVDEVLKAFILMYEDGLIYRGKRIINWCPRCSSALADIDTEFKDSQSPFIYFKYGLIDAEPYAVSLKNKFAGKEIEVTVERSKGDKFTTKNGEEYQWPFDYYGYIAGEKNPNDGEDLDAWILGFDNLKKGDKVTGKAEAIMMRFDKDYKLIVINPEKNLNELQDELEKLFLHYCKHFAGVHIIKFADYPEDKFYNNGFIIGTVRPETIFGDTAIAVDPDDWRYQEFLGKSFAVRTITSTTKLNIIGDQAVDSEFGTGSLKITPAHAMEDWDIAKRHQTECMPEKQVINFDGTMNHLAGKYNGMKADEARKTMLEDMKTAGMLISIDTAYENRIRICERCKHPIEPLVSHQWFVDTKPLKAKAKELVEQGFTEIMPEGKKKTYFDWMNTPEDWCITRQLWWGYRIPVWYKGTHEQFIDENGVVREKIAGKTISENSDYQDLLYVGLDNPNSQSETLDVIRHAETDNNHIGRISGQNDSQINANGVTQTGLLAKKLKSENTGYDLIISSPLKRTYTTATIIAKELGLEVITDDRLKERNFGILEGLLWQEAELKYPEFTSANDANYQETIPGGESIQEVESRVQEFIADIKQKYAHKKILIVTHSGVIRVFKRELGGETPAASRAHEINNLEINSFPFRLPVTDNRSPIWNQDSDVLDTWFSSGQWPYLTLKASGVNDYQDFYPTQVMETGWDILLFWVTRMMLLNPYRAAKELQKSNGKPWDQQPGEKIAPFKDVYLHGLVLDKNGVKMSKSKGNGIDPFEMMQKYGTDALRLSFILGNSVGQNYRLYEEKIANNRNFCNKLWNAGKFILMNLEDFELRISNLESQLRATSYQLPNLLPADQEMYNHIQQLHQDTTRRMDSFQFGIAAQELYDSFWHTFADIYIEKVKSRLYTKDREGNPINQDEAAQQSRKAAQAILYFCMNAYLKMLHPFAPFITEKIWQALPKSEQEAESIMYCKWKIK
ncbi:MAG: class I tRNA ligase family protein [bacterium]